jgi:peptidoglycan/LPS O-acetylase OafA/YrhL
MATRPMDNKKIIPALTGIRAICVYFIFFYHLNPFSAEQHPQWHRLFGQCYTFLTFFFVLSGFVICYKYYDIRNMQKKALYNYLVNRLSRVFPVLFILITATFLLQYRDGLATAAETAKLYFLNVTLLKGFSAQYHLTGIGPSWSMSVEELFYLIAPLVFLYVTKLRHFIKFVLLLYAMGALLTFLFSLFPNGGFFGSYLFTGYTTFFGRVFEFACGIYLALVLKGLAPGQWLQRLGRGSLYIGLAVVVLCVAGQYWVAGHYAVANAADTWPGLLLNNIGMPIGITLFFYSLVYHPSMVQRLLSTRLLVALGNATYSFYLLHTSFVLALIHKYISNNLLVSFLAMIAFAFGFYKLVEQPLAVFLRNRFSKR